MVMAELKIQKSEKRKQDKVAFFEKVLNRLPASMLVDDLVGIFLSVTITNEKGSNDQKGDAPNHEEFKESFLAKIEVIRQAKLDEISPDSKKKKRKEKDSTESQNPKQEQSIINANPEGEIFNTLLKYGMRHSENTEFGTSLIEVLIGLLERRVSSVENPILGIQMMLSHSKAEEIFLEKVQRPQKIFPIPKKEDSSEPLTVSTEAEAVVAPEITTKPEPEKKLEPEKYTIMKTCLLKLWKALTTAFVEVSQKSGTETDKRILENSVPYLMQMYGGTMSPSDSLIFDIIKLYTSPKLDILLETLPLFGPKCFETPPVGQSNPLFAHSARANTILTCISPIKAFHTALQFDPKKPATTSASYDLRFLLPLLCHILDDKNICDGRKVIAHGWVYFIAKGMSLDDPHMRSMAFLCFHRLILNFQRPKNFRSKDTKIYVHFLNGVRRGIREIGECKISNLLATWLIYVWEVLSQPSNSMFNRVTNCLFAKPTTELTILPDFVPFYNDGDDNKESRTWILNVLYYGLTTKEDWRVAQKSPTVKFLSASFLLEKVKTQRTIISILSRGAEIPEIAEDMVDKYSLPLWLSNINSTSSSLKSDLKKFFDNLVLNCPETPARTKVFGYVRSRQNWACNSLVPCRPFNILNVDQDDEIET